MIYELPKRTHLVHKPIERRNLSAKLKHTDIHDPNEYVWQLKYDGCNMMVVICQGQGTAYSRTGEIVYSCDHIIRELESLPHTHAVYFGEAYNYEWPHSKINGAFRTQQPCPDLSFVVFDHVPLDAFEAGKLDIGYMTRFNWVSEQLFKYGTKFCRPAHTFSPSRLESTESLIEAARKHGEFALDGYVAKRKEGHWIAGAGKGGEQIKVKDHLSLDLLCVGLVEGEGKFKGMIGAIKVRYKGQDIQVGGGKMTTLERECIWLEPSLLVGWIVEVHALGDSQHGNLREARFIRVRRDKTQPDD